MWISHIELSNFKSYSHQKFNFPKPENGRNLILIGGMNGFGKTTLLEAIYLCYYGSDAVSHLARAGLSNDAYGKFLKKALHGKAMSLGRSTMEVIISFQVDDVDGYEISRRWHFDPQGNYQEEEVKVYKLRSEIRSTPLQKDEITEILDTHVVPAHLAPFFFFDGEEVKKLADQDRKEWIQQGMENLLGVVLLRGLRDRLEQYQNKKRPSGKSSMDEEKLRTLFQELTENKELIEKLKNDREILNEEKLRAEEQLEFTHQHLSAMGAGGGELKQVENIVRDEGEKYKALEKVQDTLDSILASKIPFHLVNSQLMKTLKSQLDAENKRIEWDNKKQNLEPQKEKFADNFFASDFFSNPFIDRTVVSKLRESIDFAWQSLFSPEPEGCAKEWIHDYLEPRQRQRLNEQFARIAVSYKQIQDLLEQRNSLERAINDLNRERHRLEGLHDNGVLHELQISLRKHQNELDKINQELGDLNRQIIESEKNGQDQRATYEREHAKYMEASPVKSNLRKADRIIDLIKELLPKLFALKTQELSESVTDIFIKLAHKQQVSKIEIDERGVSRLLSKEGTEISLDRSAGENQIFATALIAGLAKTSGFHIPMVIDTPLGRLDSEHRKRILDYWLSDPNRQIILLSQDEEIGSDVFAQVQPHVSKTYLLIHEQLGEGVGKTIALENKYFGEAA